MGERITVVGGSDSAISVTLDGSQAIRLAQQFSEDIKNYYQNNKLLANPEDSETPTDKIGYGVITAGGAYNLGNGYDYIVVGGYNYTQDPLNAMFAIDPENANYLTDAVTINSARMNANQNVSVVAGNYSGFTYEAGQESGKLAAGHASNNVNFKGNTVNGGNWDIRTGSGDDTIITGSGSNTVYASTGKNLIDITSGIRNQVNSEGQDTIIASQSSTAQNRVTLSGGNKDYHATVNINKGASVSDTSFYNVVTVGGGSTIEGGTYGNYTFDGSNDSNMNHMAGGLSSTIQATGDLQIVQGDSNTINASQSLTFLNGKGNTLANTQGQALGFGANELNYTLNATGNDAGLFVADAGNETLNASGSTVGLSIYANTIVGGGGTNFVATGGSGNDVMVGGTGNSTFTGGAGDNFFMFDKNNSEDGKTLIKDFSHTGSNNKIALYNFGLDSDSLAELLRNSQNNDKGDAVLNLNGHTITVEGVSVSDLTVNQFDVGNPSIKSS
ncbi:Ca2+-binding protein [Commensalibacter communis]|uniref:RTX toxin-related n=1 Tax=Commensalibacter communis TaxID=2972786 RepID=A0A9W4X7D5_9PROT|nr:hypothetical protein [Commensalibacter communis]CAI3950646.1 Ca2+-binding protein [Commensalibacter communis]CAI3952442.1 Ca2+-binding protein [Commensalibacter communis]CAI3954730.1 Ca2+-binding protein [Commensalibacter communis]CAI3955030.1 Ca2+-binding protein [Commensalibacter communis]